MSQCLQSITFNYFSISNKVFLSLSLENTASVSEKIYGCVNTE